MTNFENCFTAVATKLNSILQTTKLPECITSLLLLANAHISDTQRVMVLAAAASNDPEIGSNTSNDQFLLAVSYNIVSSIVRQCDSISEIKRTNNNSLKESAASAFTYKTSYSNKRNSGCDFKELSRNEKDIIMRHSKCKQ